MVTKSMQPATGARCTAGVAEQGPRLAMSASSGCRNCR